MVWSNVERVKTAFLFLGGEFRMIKTFPLLWGISHLLGVLRDGSIFEGYSGNWIQVFVHTVPFRYINLVRFVVARMSLRITAHERGQQSFSYKGSAVTLLNFVGLPVLNTMQCSLCRLYIVRWFWLFSSRTYLKWVVGWIWLLVVVHWPLA